MSLPRVPANFLSTIRPVQALSQGTSSEGPIVVDVPPSSKFAIAWPAEAQIPVPLPAAAERPVTLSSSEGETDISEEEVRPPSKRPQKAEEFDEHEIVTPTNRLNQDENPMDQPGLLTPIPRISRAFSMPLPSQLGSLENPRRRTTSSAPPEQGSPVDGTFHDISLELADFVQMVIQTLLQLSPPQVLDPAKEQFAACSLSIPITSVSAVFTAMKCLNYISANMSAFMFQPPATFTPGAPQPTPIPISADVKDFDVGEMLQSVGDALSGVAAHTGVDLVLFHGDVGMKHIVVKGDECGISYTLSHIIRQVVCVSSSGDAIEIGLHIEMETHQPEQSHNVYSPSLTRDGAPIRCTFHITHRFGSPEASADDVSTTVRPQPSYGSLILRRLLRHVGAVLEVDPHPVETTIGHSCRISLTLEPGAPSSVNPSAPLTQDVVYLGLTEYPIANEPTLDELNQFAESLRGKKVILHANAKGSFAHHLSSYLTAWGMDVSHVSAEGIADGDDQAEDLPSSSQVPNGDSLGAKPVTPATQPAPSSPIASTRSSSETLSFVLIDDDVAVLRSRLQKLKADQAYPLHLQARKRPSLATNHRPRSSHHVTRVMGLPQSTATPSSSPVIVHFTSLANFKLVKEAIQSSLIPLHGFAVRVPEVIVIPKPAGPRRFLTALHTAVTKPVVDPFFAPIATSPLSPGVHSMSPFFGLSSALRSPSGKSSTSTRSNRSPKEHGEPPPHGSTPPVGVAEGLGYFPSTPIRMGTSPSGGLLISSPNGPPTGIFFVPKKSVGPHPSPLMERERPRETEGRNRGTSFRFPSTVVEESSSGRYNPFFPSISPSETVRPSPPVDLPISPPNIPDPKGKGRERETAAPVTEASPNTANESSPAIPGTLPPSTEPSPQSAPRLPSKRSSQKESESPSVSPVRATTGTGTRRMSRRSVSDSVPPSSYSLRKKGKMPGETNIVPPISVLIVDDNPINQTILSTFMKKKKIKYDVAKNGEEAVQKWRSGTFHLILMDIQMPVMDGIQATKEIRKIEKQNAGGFPSTPQSEGQRTPSEASTDSRSASTPQYRSSVIIVALTASSLQADRVAALAAGCNDFLTKPVSLEWLNNKIIEWGSIKALQMWADIRPEVVRGFSTGQAAQAQHVARRLHVPEGRSTPSIPRSRSPTQAPRSQGAEVPSPAKQAVGTKVSIISPDTPSSGGSAGSLLQHTPEGARPPVPTLHVQPPSTDGIAAHTTSEAPKPKYFMGRHDLAENVQHAQELGGAPDEGRVGVGPPVPDPLEGDPPGGRVFPSEPH